jgi:uncharacterized protein YxeA
MMKKILAVLGMLFLASCTSNSIYKKPKDLIPKDTMVALLADLYIAIAAFYEKNIHLERKVNYIPFIYNRYKIDSARFQTSNFYYTSVIDEYDALFKEVKDKLLAHKELLKKELSVEKKLSVKKDSIDNAKRLIKNKVSKK